MTELRCPSLLGVGLPPKDPVHELPEVSGVAVLEERLARLKDSVASAAIELADRETCHDLDAEHLVEEETLRRAVRVLARRYRETEAELRKANGRAG